MGYMTDPWNHDRECKHEYHGGAFCVKCGKRMEIASKLQSIICACGKSVNSSWIFCPACGRGIVK